MMHVLYLHGFASSPLSKKATFFRPYLEDKGATYHIPDLNQPSFEQLTLTAMLAQVADTVRDLPAPVVLVGSSMGGLTALHFYDRYRHAEAKNVEKIILLAPAFDFMDNRNQHMGVGWLEKWRAAGAWSFFNYALDGERPVHFGLVEDIQQYDSYSVAVDIPMLIYHGKNDESVNYEQSVRFAENRATVTLHLLDSDHQLLDKTTDILSGMLDFLAL